MSVSLCTYMQYPRQPEKSIRSHGDAVTEARCLEPNSGPLKEAVPALNC